MSWPKVALGEVANVIRGVTFSKSDAQLSPGQGVLPILRAGNIAGELDTEQDLVFLAERFVSDDQLLRLNDIVMCTSSGSADIVGKSAILRHPWMGSFGAFCAGVRANGALADPNFISHFLKSPIFRNWTRRSAGVGIKNIRSSALKEFEISLPPLDEQKRIAAILDKADQLRRLRRRAIERLDTLAQSIFHDMFGDPYADAQTERNSPERERSGSKLCPLGEQIMLQRGKDITKSQANDGSVPVISSGGVSFYHDTPFARGPGVLLGRKGSVGNVHFVKSDYWPHDTTLWVREFRGNNPRFVYQFFKCFPIARYEASAANPSLNRNNLHPVKVWWPPISRQNEFAEVVETAEIKKDQLNLLATKFDSLFASLQQRAFRGEL